MSINFTPQNIVPTIKAFGYHQSLELWSFHIGSLEFTIDDGTIGFVSPVGWFEVHNFRTASDTEAVASIQWVIDTYGNQKSNK